MRKKESYPVPSSGLRVAIYARKSDLTQEGRGKSVASQIESCKMSANALGLIIDERLIFSDSDGNKGFWAFEDVNTSPPFRTEFTKLVREVEAGNVDIVMCWRPDRCYRCDVIAGLFLRKLLRHGVRFFALTQDMFLHTANGFEAAISGANSARAYSDKVSEDVKRQLITNAKNGILTRKPTQLGFISAGIATGRAIPVMEQVDVVRLVFSWFVDGPEGEGPLSANGIARRLKEEGIRVSYGTRTKKDIDRTCVKAKQIFTILRNEAYHGYINHSGQVYPTQCFHFPDEAGELCTVVTEDMWQRAQAKMNGFVKYPRTTKKALLCGLTVCASCGRKVYPKFNSTRPKNLRCDNRGGRRTCDGESYRTFYAKDVEAWVRVHLAPLVAAELIAIKNEKSGEPLRRELTVVEGQIRKLQSLETETLTKHILAGMDPSQVALIGAKLKAERVAHEQRATELRSLMRRDESPTDVCPLDLVAEDDVTTRLALVRAVRFISVTQMGLVVATTEGSVIGARFAKRKGSAENRCPANEILAPTVEASKDALNWLDNPVKFLEGLRCTGQWNVKQPTDEQIAPQALLDLAQNFVPRPEGYSNGRKRRPRRASLPVGTAKVSCAA